MLTGALLIWFTLTLLSLIYLIYDLYFNMPVPNLMKVGWFLVVLYNGVFGLFIYLLSCRQPMPGTHDRYIKPLWKQAVGSTVHCLAGDVLGIVVAAVAVSFFAASPLMEAVVEYFAGFALGLLIFQALFMKNIMGGSYMKALKETFMPEWLSMNLIMGAMVPFIMIWRYFDPTAVDPSTLSFWGSMSFASILGGISGYSINLWLVDKGLKHGMVSVTSENITSACKGKVVVKEEAEHAAHGAAPAMTAAGGEHDMEKMEKGVSQTEIVVRASLTVVFLLVGVLIGLYFS